MAEPKRRGAGRRPDPTLRPRIIELSGKGLGADTISERLGISENFIYITLKQHREAAHAQAQG